MRTKQRRHSSTITSTHRGDLGCDEAFLAHINVNTCSLMYRAEASDGLDNTRIKVTKEIVGRIVATSNPDKFIVYQYNRPVFVIRLDHIIKRNNP